MKSLNNGILRLQFAFPASVDNSWDPAAKLWKRYPYNPLSIQTPHNFYKAFHDQAQVWKKIKWNCLQLADAKAFVLEKQLTRIADGTTKASSGPVRFSFSSFFSFFLFTRLAWLGPKLSRMLPLNPCFLSFLRLFKIVFEMYLARELVFTVCSHFVNSQALQVSGSAKTSNRIWWGKILAGMDQMNCWGPTIFFFCPLRPKIQVQKITCIVSHHFIFLFIQFVY